MSDGSSVPVGCSCWSILLTAEVEVESPVVRCSHCVFR